MLQNDKKPTENMLSSNGMKNPFLNLIAHVWRYGAPWRKAIVGYYAAYICAQAAYSLSPYALGRTIDVLQNFNPTRMREIFFWLGVEVGVLFIFWLFHGPARVVERRVALKIQQKLRYDLYEQITHLPLTWHQNHHSGNIITRFSRAATSLRQFAELQFIYIETIVKFFTSVAFLLWISPTIGVITIVFSLMVASIVILFDKQLIPLYTAENEIDNHVGAVLYDYISNMTTVLTLRLGELTSSNLWQRMQTVWPFFRKDSVINEVKWFTMGTTLAVVQAAILIGYIYHSLHLTGAIEIGLVVMIFRYQWELTTVFQDLSIHYSEIVRANADVSGLEPILADIKKLAHSTPGEATARQWHRLHIQDLSFHYAGANHGAIFNAIQFHVKRGEKIALIGQSGGGKSTLLNLLSGLYKPDKVKLIIDDVAFDSLEPLKAITTLIPQDPEIFENTIAFNITLDLPISDDDIMQAVKLAGFLPVLNQLPDGLATDIREKGLNLSVGQKQRLALARGLFAARFSSLILMDEPTSSVDLATEKDILANVITAFPDAAVIVSLHRLHLLPKFDAVIMLDQGKVVAHGPVDELLSNPGPVHDLWSGYQK